MDHLKELLESNKQWAAKTEQDSPGFFKDLAKQQKPKYLWIGCADSRVPANTILGLKPGNVFVHRNIANVFDYTDLNCLSVLQYSILVLKVQHVIVCGHYGCGGVKAALEHVDHGMIDNWLRPIKEIYDQNDEHFQGLSEDEQLSRLCELNVKAQTKKIASTPVVQQAWANGQKLSIHGVIYNLEDGVLNDLDVSYDSPDDIHEIYRLNK